MTLPKSRLIVVGASLLVVVWNASGILADSSDKNQYKYLDLYIFSRQETTRTRGGPLEFKLTGQPGFVFPPVLEGRCLPDDEESNTKYWTKDAATYETDKKLVCHQEYEFRCDKASSPYGGRAKCDEYTKTTTSSNDNLIFVYEAFGYWKNYLLQDWCVESTVPVGDDYIHALSTHMVQHYQYNSADNSSTTARGCAAGNAHGGTLRYGYEFQHIDEPNACWSQQNYGRGRQGYAGQTSTCNKNSGMLQVQTFPTNQCQRPQEKNRDADVKTISSYSCAEQGHNELKIETNTCASPKVYCKSLLGILPEIVPARGTTGTATISTETMTANSKIAK